MEPGSPVRCVVTGGASGSDELRGILRTAPIDASGSGPDGPSTDERAGVHGLAPKEPDPHEGERTGLRDLII